MKTSTSQQSEDPAKPTQSKSTKKTTKSRAKSSKLEINSSSSNSSKNATGILSNSCATTQLNSQQTGNQLNQTNLVTTPTTPTSSLMAGGGTANMFETSMQQHGSVGMSGAVGGRDELNSNSRVISIENIFSKIKYMHFSNGHFRVITKVMLA